MVKKRMYQKIQELRKQGISKAMVSRELNLDRGTVSKYFDMTEADFRDYQKISQNRTKLMDIYADDILDIYRKNEFRKLNMAAVFDCLEEKYGELNCSEKSLRNFIRFLISAGKLTINEKIRLYTKVPELPFGRQMQLDFGQQRTPSGLKIYIFAALLSASRYRYLAFQLSPFRTIDVIHHLLDTFDFFGGVPQELVIDQDAILVVSENRGDIVYTKDFKYFIEEMGLAMYVCRKADPESKGKIENFIKYVKNNFFQTRDFTNIESATASMHKWLSRRANGKISGATRHIPLELIEEERKHLRDIRNSIFRKDYLSKRELRRVDDKSFISFQGSLYSAPVKYRNGSIEIYDTQTALYLFDPNSGKEVSQHVVSPLPGQKIVIKWHFRHTEIKSRDIQEEISCMYDSEQWRQFAVANRKKFSRYVRDQYTDARKYFSEDIDLVILDKALFYCLDNETYSYADLRDAYRFFETEYSDDGAGRVSGNAISTIRIAIPEVVVRKRDMEDYRALLSSVGRPL